MAACEFSLSNAWIVVDLGFGDAGKGTITDFLVREKNAGLVVRFNGGAQAGHNVVTRDGRHHTFAQFGAGTFVPGTRTHLAETVVVHPSALVVEARHLERESLVRQPLDRLTVSADALVITPFHQAANCVRELARANARHGTCGVGVGEAVRDALEHPEDAYRVGDLRRARGRWVKLEEARERLWKSLEHEVAVLGKTHPDLAIFFDRERWTRWLEFVQPMMGCIVSSEYLGEWFRDKPGDVVFEGAQGVLLDENFGFHPHTTWSDCTCRGADALLRKHEFSGQVERLGVLRSYLTRHGEGPFPTENEALRGVLPEEHNASAGWQGVFRVGEMDLVLARYALRVSGGVNALAFTHADRIEAVGRIATAYEMPENVAIFQRDQAGRVVDLREGDLARQELLGQALRRVELVWADVPAGLEARIEQLEGWLRVPVRLTSSGKTAEHKAWRLSSARSS